MLVPALAAIPSARAAAYDYGPIDEVHCQKSRDATVDPWDPAQVKALSDHLAACRKAGLPKGPSSQPVR